MTDLTPLPEISCQLLYDGECPMCSAFARVADAAEAGQLKKVDARQDSILRAQATAAGMDLDYGIVVEHGGVLYYGADALTYLATMEHRSLTLKLLYLPFRSQLFSRWFYPVLVRVRWFFLWLERKSFIHNLSPGN